MSRAEFAELAEIQYKLAQVMRQDTHVEKEYMMCFADMKIYNPDRSEPVILSAAKNLAGDIEILRCAQNDIPEFDR